MFAAGMALFIVAPALCERVVFHYTTGTLVGVLGSVLIVIYLVSRLIPKVSKGKTEFTCSALKLSFGPEIRSLCSHNWWHFCSSLPVQNSMG